MKYIILVFTSKKKISSMYGLCCCTAPILSYRCTISNHKYNNQCLLSTCSKTCVKRSLSKWQKKNGFQDRFSLNAGQKYCKMLQMEHFAIQLTSLSYQFSLRPLFCLFMSGRFIQSGVCVLTHPYLIVINRIQFIKYCRFFSIAPAQDNDPYLSLVQ